MWTVSAGGDNAAMTDRPPTDDELWARQVGPALAEPDTARLLERPVAEVATDPGLLRVRNRDGQLVYPIFQFDGRRPLPGLAQTLAILREATTESGVLAWLTGYVPDLNGTPADALRAGDIDTVLSLATLYTNHNRH